MPAVNARVDALTQKFALLGGSLPHTLSPQIHNTLFDARLLNALYIPLPVPEHSLASAIDVLRQCFDGFNVTIPYKEAVIPFLDELSITASACGAVNTVEITEGGSLIGHNTDGTGLMQALTEALMPVSGAQVLVLGSGGTARIAVHELLLRGCHVTLAARHPEKATALLQALSAAQEPPASHTRVTALCDLPAENQHYDLLLNATPVGMYPGGDVSPVPESVVERCEAVFDAIYNPPQTKLLSIADSLGLKTANGSGMLFFQAVEAQRIWFGRVSPPKVLREVRRALHGLF